MKIDEKDKELNPSSRGTKRYISKIVRCPQRKSKISISSCEGCIFFKGFYKGDKDDFITCIYTKKCKGKP
jgi:hypothetical protein